MTTALSPLASPVAAVRRTRSTDIDAHTEQLQDWNLLYDQLDCGAFEGGFTDVRSASMQLFAESTTRRVRQRGHLMPQSCGFATLLQGEGALHLNGIRSGTQTLLACESTELDLCTPAHCTLVGMVVDARTLYAAAEAMGETRPLPGPNLLMAVTPPEPALSAWRTLLVTTLQSAVERPGLLDQAGAERLVRDDLLLQLIGLLTSARPCDEVPRARARKRLVDRACDMLMSKPDTPQSLLQVCHEVGASPRKLGYCFQDVLGLSPARFIKTTRLNAVRRALARPGPAGQSVYDVAAEWGFWHFGHFSADYKKQFGELPSCTLKRATLH